MHLTLLVSGAVQSDGWKLIQGYDNGSYNLCVLLILVKNVFHEIHRNYGPTILAQRHAEMQGLQQVLWLFGENRQVRSLEIIINIAWLGGKTC